MASRNQARTAANIERAGPEQAKEEQITLVCLGGTNSPGTCQKGQPFAGAKEHPTALQLFFSSVQQQSLQSTASFVVSHLNKLKSYTAIPSFNHLIHVLIQAIDNFNVLTLIQFMYLLCFC